ncbi:hypothetical protein BPAE_0038g00530 [Botrytis paeoniae]|uniref:Uncharacterized protein n=1 Tax=Botrytis paeoniae TaxID=278948 RepID=A0A4Z1G0S7_9HELO|nr:hypothetical protein BPAE_0038g00530 [Botrytis paeoniae]
MLTPDHVKTHAIKDSSNKNNARPIHGNRSNDLGIRPEAEKHGNRRINQSSDIGNWTKNWAQFPWSPMYSVFDWVFSKAFLENQDDLEGQSGKELVKNAATLTETIELNAAVLPILISANRSEITALTRIEYTGNAVGS